MKRYRKYNWLIPVYILTLSLFVFAALGGSRAVTVLSESRPLEGRHCIVIDAGHGGVDGGATSVTGVLESKVNLEIALRLDDLFHFLGYDTLMIRTSDISVYTQGDTIAQKKVSDLKQRVKLVNSAENALLLSIHQNKFSDGRYSGAQVFYNKNAGSEELAKALQAAFISALHSDNDRVAKRADGVYLMEHIDCTGVLIECGFLSSPVEEAKLLDPDYQKKLCCVISCTVSNYLDLT